MHYDTLATIVSEDGFSLEEVKFTPHNPDSLVIGYRFIKDEAEFVCRVDEKDSKNIMLVFYGTLKKKKGLKNGFNELMWFASYLKQKGFRTLSGCVLWDKKKYPWGTSAHKMHQFYLKIGGTSKQDTAGRHWIIYPLEQFSTMRNLLKIFGKNVS